MTVLNAIVLKVHVRLLLSLRPSCYVKARLLAIIMGKHQRFLVPVGMGNRVLFPVVNNRLPTRGVNNLPANSSQHGLHHWCVHVCITSFVLRVH